MNEYITIKEIAQEHSVSQTAVYKKICSGELRAEKIGSQYLVLKKDAQYIQFRRKKRSSKTKAIQKAVARVVKEHEDAFKMLGED